MKIVKVFSDVFSKEQSQKIVEYFYQPKWEFGHCSNPNPKSLFWIMHFNDDKFFTEELFEVVKQHTSSYINSDFDLERVYANGQTFGQDGEFHIDSSSENDYSFLYYPKNYWDISWGGETVIKNPNGNVHYLHPIENCAVLFPANWWHCGRGPTKECNILRVTISFKLLGKNKSFS